MDHFKLIDNLQKVFLPDGGHSTKLLSSTEYQVGLVSGILPISGNVDQTMHSSVAHYSHRITAEFFPVSKEGKPSSLFRHKLPNNSMLEEALTLRPGCIHKSEGRQTYNIEERVYTDNWDFMLLRVGAHNWLSFQDFTRVPFTIVANIRRWETRNGSEKLVFAAQHLVVDSIKLTGVEFDFATEDIKVRWVSTYPHNVTYRTPGGTYIHDERTDRLLRLEAWLKGSVKSYSEKPAKFILDAILRLVMEPKQQTKDSQRALAEGVEALTDKTYLSVGSLFTGAQLEKRVWYYSSTFTEEMLFFPKEDPLNPCSVIVR